MNQSTLLPHLFRTEFRKIVAVLSRLFGLEHIEIAEDIASETFLLAAETWGKKGIPENPTAWIYAVAKNKSKDYLKRNQLFKQKVSPALKIQESLNSEEDFDIKEDIIKDSEIQMMFAICHPSIPLESQIGLALRILFGLGIEEIAEAFLSNKETINKRLLRAKEKLRLEQIELELPRDEEILSRLDSVLLIIYLLFNEGYYSSASNAVLRKEICLHALEIAYILSENERTNTPPLNALIALMCFHTSRFEARLSNENITLWEQQDTNLWNKELITLGEFYLNRAAKGDKINKYHLEAAIAYWHTRFDKVEEKWSNILNYYDILLKIEYAPIAALNRAFAVFMVHGADAAIKEVLKLDLINNMHYYALLGHLYAHRDKEKAIDYLNKAIQLSKSDKERSLLLLKMNAMN